MKKKQPDNKSKLKVRRGAKKAPANFLKHSIKPGEVRNPAGRPKGSRTVFAETFLKDFLADWNEHGADAVAKVRLTKPTEYVKIGASLLPKDFNLNLTNEADLDKILDQFDDDQLRAMLAAIAAAAKSNNEEVTASGSGTQSDRVH